VGFGESEAEVEEMASDDMQGSASTRSYVE
jgi:hypothetical protein